MNKEVKAALSGIKSAWKNMLTAQDRDTYEFWRDEQLRLQKILYDERGKTLRRLRKSEELQMDEYKKNAVKKTRIQRYQHEYYLRVTRQKRAERRNNEAQK